MFVNVNGTYLQKTKGYFFLRNVRECRHLLSTVTVMFAVLLVGILQGAERPGSVYSIIISQW
jgi:hypothetical protein